MLSSREEWAGRLRLVDAPELAPLPSGDALLQTHARRPGDRHEVVAVPAAAQASLGALAADCGLAPDVVAAVLLEGEALACTSQTIAGPRAADELDRVAARVHVDRALTAAEAAYLRALTWRPDRPLRTRAPATVALPVRLLSRVHDAAWPTHPDLPALERFMRWEAAALMAGRTLTEWGLEQLLRRAHAGDGRERAAG